jgi:hypothetical protein
MEYKVGDYIMFGVSKIPAEYKRWKTFTDMLKEDSSKTFRVIRIKNGFYYLDIGYMQGWYDCDWFLTKLEVRRLKINKILTLKNKKYELFHYLPWW